MKKILLIISIGLLFIIGSGTALGEMSARNTNTMRISVTKNPEITKSERKEINLDKKNEIRGSLITKTPGQTQSNLDKKTASLKQRAGEEISRRITTLTNLIDKIQKIKKLSNAQKTGLITNIQTEITNLNTLNAKIQNDTDPQTLREDVKSIITSYRIYLLFMPVSRIIIAADGIDTAADKLDQLAVKLQKRIMELENNEDKHNLENILADMQIKIADAKTQAGNAITAVNPLQPTDYPGNKKYLQNAREILQKAWKDIQTARQDAQKIIVALRKNDTNDPSASHSAKPTRDPKIKNNIHPTDLPDNEILPTQIQGPNTAQ